MRGAGCAQRALGRPLLGLAHRDPPPHLPGSPHKGNGEARARGAPLADMQEVPGRRRGGPSGGWRRRGAPRRRPLLCLRPCRFRICCAAPSRLAPPSCFSLSLCPPLFSPWSAPRSFPSPLVFKSPPGRGALPPSLPPRGPLGTRSVHPQRRGPVGEGRGEGLLCLHRGGGLGPGGGGAGPRSPRRGLSAQARGNPERHPGLYVVGGDRVRGLVEMRLGRGAPGVRKVSQAPELGFLGDKGV